MSDDPRVAGLIAALKRADRAQLSQTSWTDIDLSKRHLNGLDFSDLKLGGACFNEAHLENAKFERCDLHYAKFGFAKLQGADFRRAGLKGVAFRKSKLMHADLTESNLEETDFTDADLSGASLVGARLVGTVIEGATLTGCRVYGLSAWDIQGTPKDQSGLIVTPASAATVTVDSLEMAQAIHLLSNHRNMLKLIDTYSSKVALLLGRFKKRRKKVLDAVRRRLADMDLAPVVFDFDEPRNRDKTETVIAIASIARFVIVDITNASYNVAQELNAIIPNLPSVPVRPVLMEGHKEPALFEHWQGHASVLDTFRYRDTEHLLSSLEQIVPCPSQHG